MKREILFRGMVRWNKKWIYGMPSEDFQYIFDGKAYDVADANIIPETVGQFTGLTDKNGVKIFEGDILLSPFGSKTIVEFKNHKTSSPSQGGNDNYEYLGYNHSSAYSVSWSQRIVIGNIHQNPELL